ncbi:5-methylcytosine-specific restriction protein B [Arthrobacter sp. GAS37]
MVDLDPKAPGNYWFVGAYFNDRDPQDQTERFLADGIWENGFEDQLLDTVKSMQPGDKIAIKSAYVRKRDLPFENHQNSVSTLAIKAVGTITRNHGDGRCVDVDWTRFGEPREWYFYTARSTVWKVSPKDWKSEGLIRFAFQGQPQDLDRFRNDPAWAARFGDSELAMKYDFAWTTFYEELATKLLTFKNNRSALLAILGELQQKHTVLDYLIEKASDGASKPLTDICPFTVLATFNRGITSLKRTALAADWGKALGVSRPAPVSFDGIPLVNNMNSWFFQFSDDQGPDDIDKLWKVFEASLDLSGTPEEHERAKFVDAYDAARILPQVKTKLSMGLFWSRPWNFLPLDGQSRRYLKSELMLDGNLRAADGAQYLATIDLLLTKFDDTEYAVHSFPELSWAAFLTPGTSPAGSPSGAVDEDNVEQTSAVPLTAYNVEDIVAEGCFLPPETLQEMLDRWHNKKNLILQGPPGTGKTWLARRLAQALIGTKDLRSAIRAVQFHPNASYEDFIRGWRPGPDGQLALVDGPFLEMVEHANAAPELPHVLLIEEINRGNPVQIFGELLTLIEAGKRSPREALHLAYPRASDETVHVPSNLYIIGTMNLADRSLAIMDLAFRRRFGFISLEPAVNDIWIDWVHANFNVPKAELKNIQLRFATLNQTIADDPNLGSQFMLGHSFITPTAEIDSFRDWFEAVVATEISPTLDEYWFDNTDKARSVCQELLS